MTYLKGNLASKHSIDIERRQIRMMVRVQVGKETPILPLLGQVTKPRLEERKLLYADNMGDLEIVRTKHCMGSMLKVHTPTGAQTLLTL